MSKRGPADSPLVTRLRAHLSVLAQKPRVPGTPEHAAARAYLGAQLSAFGFDVSEVRHASADVTNVHARIGSPSGPLWVIGAHYDSVPGSPGADDNASGVAALLELARKLAEKPPSARVELVAYDREEDGLVRSRAHCWQLRRERAQVAGMLSLEMLGFTHAQQTQVPGVTIASTRGDFLAVVANARSAELLNLFDDASEMLPIERVVVPEGSEAAALAQLSDHGSFWGGGWPALLVTDTAFLRNPHYHRASDRPDTLDFDFLARSTEQVAQAVSRFGGARK